MLLLLLKLIRLIKYFIDYKFAKWIAIPVRIVVL